MSNGPAEDVVDYFRKSCGTLKRATDDRDTHQGHRRHLTRAFRVGGNVLIAGDGDSAADAQQAH